MRWVASAYILLMVLHQQNQELFGKPLSLCNPKTHEKMCLLDLLVNIIYFLPEGNMVADTSRRQAAELAEMFVCKMVPPPVASPTFALTAGTSSTCIRNPGKFKPIVSLEVTK